MRVGLWKCGKCKAAWLAPIRRHVVFFKQEDTLVSNSPDVKAFREMIPNGIKCTAVSYVILVKRGASGQVQSKT